VYLCNPGFQFVYLFFEFVYLLFEFDVLGTSGARPRLAIQNHASLRSENLHIGLTAKSGHVLI
jgi:hypothetical protein